MKYFKISLTFTSLAFLLNACSNKESLVPKLNPNGLTNTLSLDEASKIAVSNFSQILGNSKSRIGGEPQENKK